jgi:hypothetical protein
MISISKIDGKTLVLTGDSESDVQQAREILRNVSEGRVTHHSGLQYRGNRSEQEQIERAVSAHNRLNTARTAPAKQPIEYGAAFDLNNNSEEARQIRGY